MNRYEQLKAKVLREFPRFQVRKASETWWLRWAMGLLRLITRSPVGGFTTTIFSTVYVEDDWDRRPADDRYATLRHELMHIRQFHHWPIAVDADLDRGGWWRVVLSDLRRWTNHLCVMVAYLFLCPAFWTMRARFEREGYTQTLLVARELYGELGQATMESKARWLASVFGGPDYAWMWNAGAAYRWAMDTQRKINAGMLWNPGDRCDLPSEDSPSDPPAP
jgi:hypothetical protein